ncbi:restriction endonuclease subunit S [Paraburkholderia sediminicola]|uniref:restriction endonuclease subunit S n=1 Tax=Paraburkholderia sediminicola TaxID=458836 RepID=UPI0038B9847B
MARAQTVTGGRNATAAVIPGKYALSVGLPNLPAPKGWQWTPLSSVARLESGHTPSRRHPEYWGGDIPWIGIRDATGNHGRVIHDTIEHTNALGIENSSARVLPAKTVCLSRTASVGYVVVTGREMATSQDFVNWICSEDLNPHFLKYVLLAEREALHVFAVGSVHQTIYFPEAKAFHVCMPIRKVQDAIVDVLGALDDKIEENRQMSVTLEAAARALYRDWFVEFGPTRAKMEGRAPYLEESIWSLFPQNIDADGKPQGWTISAIGDEVDVVGGSTPSTKEAQYWGGNIAWATPKDLSSLKTPVLLSTERQISDLGLSQIGSGLLPTGTVLLSSRAPIGYLAIAEIPVAVNQGFIAMICKRRLSNVFIWQWTQASMDQVHQRANGSTFQEISKANFRPIAVTVGTPDVHKAFDALVRPIFERIASNEREIRSLAATRDFLLPRLMSGEVLVKDAETRVGEIT